MYVFLIRNKEHLQRQANTMHHSGHQIGSGRNSATLSANRREVRRNVQTTAAAILQFLSQNTSQL